MWYIMKSDEGAKLYSGLKREITPEEYKELVENDTICDALAQYEVSEGDVFFLPAGRIHAIGGGCFLAEVQQTSDITYRIYDYKRPGLDGKPRQLHTQEAKDAIDYQVCPEYRTLYEPREDEPVELVRCPYFTTTLYDLTPKADGVFQTGGPESPFVILIGLAGSCTLRTDRDGTVLRAGEAVLVPAADGSLAVLPDGEGVKFLSVRP